MAYLGNTAQNQNYVPAIDYFNGDGTTVAFTLSRPVAAVAQVQVVVNNVAQNPGSAFTVLNSTITFTGAPSAGTGNIYVYYTSPNTQVIQPGQGTVGNTQMVSGAAVSNIGYTPANKAGDIFTGNVSVGGWTRAYGQVPVDSDTTAGVFLGTGNGGTGNNPRINLNTGNASELFQIDNSSGQFRVFKPGAVFLAIDGSGRVTTPQQPSFWCTTTGCGRNATTGVVEGYPTPFFNVGSAFNVTTGKFTAPVGGLYVFWATKYNNATSNANLVLQVNGSQRSYTDFNNSGTLGTHINATLYFVLSVGDTVAMYISSGMNAGDSNDYFGGFLAG